MKSDDETKDQKNPSDEIIKMGEVMKKIGETLKPFDRVTALRILKAVAILHGIEL